MPAPTPPWQQRRFIFKHAAVAASIASILGVVASIPVSPTPKHQPPWIEKDWTRWTSSDINRVLNQSPWGRRSTVTLDTFKVTTTDQLRSALPIRQALLRRLQIEKRYDEMNPQQKRAFDLEHTADIQETDDTPILYFTANVVGMAGSTLQPYKYTEQAVDESTFALRLSDGTLIMPSQVTVLHYDDYDKEYLFAFPRRINGKRIVGRGDKNLTFVEGQESISISKPKKHGPINLGPIRREDYHPATKSKTQYDIASLMYKGKPEY